MKKPFLSVCFPIFLGLFLLTKAASLEAAISEGWYRDFSVALEEAQKEQKPLLLIFEREACPACNTLNTNVLNDEGFQKDVELSHIPVMIMIPPRSERDASYRNQQTWDLLEKYEVKSVPTLMVLTPQQEMVKRGVGLQEIGRDVVGVESWLEEKKEISPSEVIFSNF